MTRAAELGFELDVGGRPVRGAAALPAGDPAGSGHSWVVLSHGFRSHRRWGFFPALTRALTAEGLAVVGFDYSGSGIGADGRFSVPELFCHDTYSKELDDLDAVLEHVRSGALFPADPARGSILGHSRGAGVALLAAAERGDLAALGLWACITQVASWSAEKRRLWRERGYHPVPGPLQGEIQHLAPDVIDDAERQGARFDLAAAARRSPSATLLVHGDRDRGLPVAEVSALFAHFPAGRAQLEVVAGGRHDFSPPRTWSGAPPLAAAIEVSRRFLVSELRGRA